MSEAKYSRVLLKLSGEVLAGDLGWGICQKTLARLSADIIDMVKHGVQVALVIGGGNWMRGRTYEAGNAARITADTQGMLSTIINALSLQDALLAQHHKACIYSAIGIEGVVPKFDRLQALDDLTDYRVVICAGGTGNPLVTTDSAASLRAVELDADILLKGTQVDGVYSADPKHHADATLLPNLTYEAVLQAEYGVMDISAFSQCRDFKMPIRIFNIKQPGVLQQLVQGEAIGTYIGEDKRHD